MVDYISKLSDGNYVLLKPAYKSGIRIYRVEHNGSDESQHSDE